MASDESDVEPDVEPLPRLGYVSNAGRPRASHNYCTCAFACLGADPPTWCDETPPTHLHD